MHVSHPPQLPSLLGLVNTTEIAEVLILVLNPARHLHGSSVMVLTLFLLHHRDWKHGAVFVNGFNIGRYHQVSLDVNGSSAQDDLGSLSLRQ